MTTLRWRPINTTPSVSPAWSTAWDGAGEIPYRKTITTDSAASRHMTGTSATVDKLDSPRTEYMQQLVGSGLVTGVLSGTFRSVFVADVFTFAGDTPPRYLRVIARIFDSTGTVDRGIIFDGVTSDITSGTDVARICGGPIIGGVVAQAGDILVVEVGGHVGTYTDNNDHTVRIIGYGPSTSYPDIAYADANYAGNESAWVELELDEIPTTPTGLEEVHTHDEAGLTWLASSGTVTGYHVRLNGGAFVDVGNTLSHVFTGLEPETTYSLQVRAYGPVGNSSWATIASTTSSAPIPVFALTWDAIENRRYETGLDRGVLYLADDSGVPWNGLTSVDENIEIGAAPFYFDGKKYVDMETSGDFAATLRAITYPDEFLEYDGIMSLGGGLYVDNQPVKRFGLSYRTRIGNVDGPEYGYKIHILYNLTATINTKDFQTTTSATTPLEFSWDISGVPETLDGYRPTSHVVLDTTELDPGLVSDLEAILYGDATTEARLPSLVELAEFMENWALITITDHGDGRWSATGPDELITMLDSDTFQIDEVNAVYLDSGTYEITNT